MNLVSALLRSAGGKESVQDCPFHSLTLRQTSRVVKLTCVLQSVETWWVLVCLHYLNLWKFEMQLQKHFFVMKCLETADREVGNLTSHLDSYTK